jgi:hypothetical protein
MLAKVAGKDTRTVVTALIKQAKKLPKELYKSLTWDRGKELTDHRRFTLATKIDVYFCDPQSPWQRGSNENTNGLLRQYFPKGTDLSVHSQAHLNKVARQLNERPRETLQFETPAERFVEPHEQTSSACPGMSVWFQFQTFSGLRVVTAQTMRFDEVAERQTKADKTGDSSSRPAAPATTFPPTRI